MRKNIVISLAVLLLSAAFGLAQSVATGDLHVSVKDPSGKLVTDAKVIASDSAKGLERTAAGNAQGEYRVLALPPGTYRVSVEAPGFAKVEADKVIVTVGQVVDLPVTLSVAGTREVVNVSSAAELVETTRSSTTDTVEQRSIDDLPINGRNYIDFTLTDSQVVRDNAPNIGAAPTSGLNMSGQRARSNLVNVDGADATDNSTNGVRSTVSQEDVQEFQILTNGYAAEYGRAAGGVVNIITRSGSNEFHGDVFGYLRNRDFQATNPFSTVPNPAYTRVQAGAAFGGPIKKDKTYYFFSYEITRRHETGFATLGQGGLPYWQLQNFDATNIFAPGLAPPGTFDIQVTPQQAQFLSTPGLPGPLLQQYAFLAGASSGIALNGAYPRSFRLLLGAPGGPPIPANGTNPLAQFASSCNPLNPLCNGLPSSFLTLNSQVGNFPVFEGTSLYALRLDHNITDRNRLMLRANVSPSTVTGIEVNGEDQTFGQNAFSRTSEQTYRDAAGEAQDTWTIGNNRVNELRFQYARRGLLYNYSSAPGGSDVAVNIPGFGYFGREPYSYIQRTEQRYQFADNFSWSIGRHDTKFGGDFDYIPVNATFTVNYGGVYAFGGLTASQVLGSSFASLPASVQALVPGFNAVEAYGLGVPQTLVQGIGNPHDSFSNKPLGVFWQDSWRARPNLTLNYGVRYDVEFVPKFAPPDPLALAAYNSLGLQKGIQTDTNNVQPRVGLAWDPRGNGKDVIRASYGIFYDHPLLGLFFLGDASDGSKSGQLLFGLGGPCVPGSLPDPGSLNATNVFQGTLNAAGTSCALNVPGYQGSGQRFNPAPFTAPSAANPGLFVNQSYLNPSSFFPLAFQPFGYPQAQNFVYAYSQQANLTLEHDFGHDLALSLAYNFNGGRHLNRPINANTVRGDYLLKNWQAAVAGGAALATDNPLGVSGCGVGPAGPYVPAALMNFFRPSGLNPAIALGLLSSAATAPCVQTIAPLVFAEDTGLSKACNPATLAGCVPFSDMVANYSNGSSDYNGFTANLRKRFSSHYEFLASYTYAHAIDDSTDLQAPLSPQDSYFPSLDRSNSLFDQRHRFVFSGVYQSGKLSGGGFSSKLLSNWTVAPIVDVASGRPFNILTGDIDNFQFSPDTGRPNVVPNGNAPTPCGPPVASKFSPTGFFQEPCYAVFAAGGTPTLLSLDGTLGRNAGFQTWTVFNDLRIARRIYFGERVNMDLIADMFNIANRFNVSAVNQLFTAAGQPTAAYDPRQFQFAMKVNW
jgi:carboxypeptidase family protein/TonB-dependent receptor-like protein